MMNSEYRIVFLEISIMKLISWEGDVHVQRRTVHEDRVEMRVCVMSVNVTERYLGRMHVDKSIRVKYLTSLGYGLE